MDPIHRALGTNVYAAAYESTNMDQNWDSNGFARVEEVTFIVDLVSLRSAILNT
jgi:hypothetical protein